MLNSACNVCGPNCGEVLPVVPGVLLEELVPPDAVPVADPVACPIAAKSSDSGSDCVVPAAVLLLPEASCANSDCHMASGLLLFEPLTDSDMPLSPRIRKTAPAHSQPASLRSKTRATP